MLSYKFLGEKYFLDNQILTLSEMFALNLDSAMEFDLAIKVQKVSNIIMVQRLEM